MTDTGWSPEPQWSPPPQPVPAPPWIPPPPAPPARHRRWRLGIVALLAAVLGGLVTWLVWPSSGPTLTYHGKSIAQAGTALSRTESLLQTYVQNRHGASNESTRCYFTVQAHPAKGAAENDVGDALWCGPVLFVDGDASKPYVAVHLTSHTADTRLTLTPPTSLDNLPSYAADDSLKLVRPDGKTPPSPTRLAVPAPPHAARGVQTIDTLGPVRAPRSVGTRMISKTAGVVLDAAGVVPRYGQFDGARSAPPGQQLIAFQFHFVPGDVTEGFTSQAQVVIDGRTTRQVPQTDSADQWDIVAIGLGSTAVLQLRDGGYTQTLSLPDGKPGAHNLAVLGRRHRSEILHRKPTVAATFSNGFGSVSVTFHVHATIALLDYWVPGHPTKHATGPGRAILTVHLTYTDPDQPGKTFGFEPDLLRLRLPNGKYVHSRNVARKKNFVFDIFEVPASFTRGTVQITGSDDVGGITLTISETVGIAVSIPAS